MRTGSLKIGQTIGMFKIVSHEGKKRYDISKRSVSYYRVKCANCGETTVRCGGNILKFKYTLEQTGQQIRCQQCFNRPQGESGRVVLLRNYKSGAKKRGYCFELTDEQFAKLTKTPCFYCGVEPSQLVRVRLGNKSRGAKWRQNSEKWRHSGERNWGDYVYSGIDRKDPSLGYTPDNSVPCCGACNCAKSDRPYEQFVDYIKRIRTAETLGCLQNEDKKW